MQQLTIEQYEDIFKVYIKNLSFQKKLNFVFYQITFVRNNYLNDRLIRLFDEHLPLP